MAGTGAAAAKKALSAAGAVKKSEQQLPRAPRCLVLGPEGPFGKSFPVTSDSLSNPTGGLAREASGLRARAVAVPGLDCSITDVAEEVLAHFQAADPTVPLGPSTLACAIFAYNQDILVPGSPRDPSTPLTLPFPEWKVGHQLSLPLEYDDTNQGWVTDIAQIRAWGSAYQDWAYILLGGGSASRTQELALPDLVALGTEAKAAIPKAGMVTDPFDPAAFAADLRKRLLTNACEAVFYVYAAMREFEQQPRAAWPFLLPLIDGLEDHHAQLLGAISGGNAVLRRFWTFLERERASVPASEAARLLRVRRRVADTGLKLQPTTAADEWMSPEVYGPGLAPLEPALAEPTRIQGTSVVLHAMALGRAIPISTTRAPKKGEPSWGNLSYQGQIDAVSWLEAHGADPDIDRTLSPRAPAAPHDSTKPTFPSISIPREKVRERLRIAARISGIEGGLDSAQAGDKGLVSFGFEQWAAHNEQELTVLLDRFRAQAPDHYDLFFGMCGLQTWRWASSWKSGAAPTSDEVDDANPYGPDPALLSAAERLDYFPTFATFVQVAAGTGGGPGAAATPIPAPPFSDQKGPRVDLLMAGQNPRKWCARTRLAALVSGEFRRVQAQQAAWRFTRIEYEHPRSPLVFDKVPRAVRFQGFAVPGAALALRLARQVDAATRQMSYAPYRPLPARASFHLLCEREVMRFKARSGKGQLVVDRHAEGTAAVAHPKDAELLPVFPFAVLGAAAGGAATDNSLTVGRDKYDPIAGGWYLPGQEPVRLLCEQEILHCTARTADTLTVVRRCEGTAVSDHAPGTRLFRLPGATALKSSVDSTATLVEVEDASVFPAGPLLLSCGSEVMRVVSHDAANPNLLEVARGEAGSPRVAHSAGAPVDRAYGYVDLFGSEYGAALILDYHINVPTYALETVRSAIARTPGDAHRADGSLDPAWLQRLAVNYLAARATYPDGSPWINAPARNNFFICLIDDPFLGLSPDTGTFSSWETSP
jgi:hypothetical protein